MAVGPWGKQWEVWATGEYRVRIIGGVNKIVL